jgi:hypothetical protein
MGNDLQHAPVAGTLFVGHGSSLPGAVDASSGADGKRRTMMFEEAFNAGDLDGLSLGREKTRQHPSFPAVRSGDRITDTRLVGGRRERMPLRRVPCLGSRWTDPRSLP